MGGAESGAGTLQSADSVLVVRDLGRVLGPKGVKLGPKLGKFGPDGPENADYAPRREQSYEWSNEFRHSGPL